MSLGKQLLAAIIAAGDRTVVRRLRPEFFVQDEAPFYDYFTSYLNRYGSLPSLEVMRTEGYPLPSEDRPLQYLVDRVTNRATYNAVQANLAQFQQHLARQNGEGLRAIIAEMNAAVAPLGGGEGVFSLYDASELAMYSYAEARDNGGEMRGTTLGWPGLDALTSGAMPGEVITWVARPNVGKSYAIAHSALAAHAQGKKVLLVSMEMSAITMARRLIAIKAGINPDYLKRGTLGDWGEQIMHETIERTKTEPQFTLVSGNFTKSVRDVDGLIQEHRPDVVYLDAQYLMQPMNGNRGMKQFEALAQVGIEVQQMAIARNIPIHQSVQYNRDQRKNEEGDLARIGGTDVVGQISSIVIGIQQPEGAEGEAVRVYEVIKNRDGQLGSIRANFRFDPINFSEIVDGPLDPNDWTFGGA